MSYSMWYVLLWVPAMCIVTLRASCGAVYCNQSCLFVCGWVPLSIVTVILQMNLGQPVSTEAKDDGGGGDNWTTGATSRVKLQPNHHHQQTNIHFLQARCPSCRPTNSVKALKGKIITFHGLPSSPGVFQHCLWPLIARGYLGEGCHASHQPSDARCNQSCLFVCVGGSVTSITRNCVHRSSPNLVCS